MKIQFNSELEDSVDVQMRIIERSGILKKRKLLVLFWIINISSLFCFFAPLQMSYKAAIVGAALGAYFYTYFVKNKKIIREAVRECFLKEFGSEEALPASLEATSDELIYIKKGNGSREKWSDLEQVIEKEEGTELLFSTGNVAILKTKFFTNKKEEESFLSVVSKNSKAKK